MFKPLPLSVGDKGTGRRSLVLNPGSLTGEWPWAFLAQKASSPPCFLVRRVVARLIAILMSLITQEVEKTVLLFTTVTIKPNI